MHNTPHFEWPSSLMSISFKVVKITSYLVGSCDPTSFSTFNESEHKQNTHDSMHGGIVE